MIQLDLLVALVSALRPRAAADLLSNLTGPGAMDATRRATLLAERPRIERAAALAASLRAGLTGSSASLPRRATLATRLLRDLEAWR
jgi:hypothetical protein